MADSWRDSEVAVRDQPGGFVISWFPPGTLSSILAVRPRGFESSAQLWWIKAGEAGSLRVKYINPGAF